MTNTHDVIVIGSGAAGLTAALALAETRKVLVLAKGSLTGGSTAWAQGGIAAVLDAGDTFEDHIRDTMVAGAGLNRLETVEFVIENAPAAIERLIELGVPFNMDRDTLHLTREGGHSHRRIVHVDDATGWAVQEALLKAAGANPNITLLPGRSCIDLITGRNAEKYSGSGRVWGVYALDEATGKVEAHVARATIMATGGAGRVYQFSTAPRGATGDGIAMAWRAGARVSNMEMMQFHPTCLYNLEVKNFLITEAVRGEGGILKNPKTGHRYMPDYDERAELAPRDIVARANDDQIKRDGLDFVHLDISHQPPEFVKEHFPNIHEKLIGLGHRHDHRADPGRPRAALHLRRGADRARRAHRPARLVGGGRSDRERAARRQPPCFELAARMLRVRRGGGEGHPRRVGRDGRAPRDPRMGRQPGDRLRRGSGDPAELDRDPPDDVELRRDRAHHQAPRARGAPDRPARARDRRTITAVSASPPTSSNCATCTSAPT